MKQPDILERVLKRKEYYRMKSQEYYQKMKDDPAHKHMIYRQSANHRKLEFTLTLEQFTLIIQSEFMYCDKKEEGKLVGIDRVDSNGGYTVENVVSCCPHCNYMKKDMSFEEFLTYSLKRMAEEKGVPQLAGSPQDTF